MWVYFSLGTFHFLFSYTNENRKSNGKMPFGASRKCYNMKLWCIGIASWSSNSKRENVIHKFCPSLGTRINYASVWIRYVCRCAGPRYLHYLDWWVNDVSCLIICLTILAYTPDMYIQCMCEMHTAVIRAIHKGTFTSSDKHKY